MLLKISQLIDSAIIPKYQHPDDSGLDLVAIEPLEILPGESQLVRTGIAIELPENTEAQIRPRSGLALKHQITVLNSPGTIDRGYRGEIGVILINHGKKAFQVSPGMRIAQMVIVPIIRVQIQAIDSLSHSSRNAGGFGSTGLN